MKTLFFKLTFLLNSIFIPHAFAGIENGHGGDHRSAEFVSIAYDLLSRIELFPIEGIKLDALRQAVQLTRVHSTSDLLVDINSNLPVDAINYYDDNIPYIKFRKDSWDELQAVPHLRRRLVLHEYLGIMGVSDHRYQLSSQIDKDNICGKHPAILDAIFRNLKGFHCDQLTNQHLGKMRFIQISFTDGILPIQTHDLTGFNMETTHFTISAGTQITPQAKTQIKSLITEVPKSTGPQTQDNSIWLQEFTDLKRLEIKLSALPNQIDWSQFTDLEELILFSGLKNRIKIPDNYFKSLEHIQLRRFALCDRGELHPNEIVHIPNIIASNLSLMGLHKVEEITLCLMDSKTTRINKNIWQIFQSAKRLWFKVDRWHHIDNDFFAPLLSGTSMTLIPSGYQFSAEDYERFDHLICDREFIDNNQRIEGKVYCKRKEY